MKTINKKNIKKLIELSGLQSDLSNFKQLHQGFTNISFYVKLINNKEYQIRFGMNNKIVSRENEFNVLNLTFKNLFLYYDLETGNAIKEWIAGRTLKSSDYTDEFIIKLLKEIDDFHKIKIPKNVEIISHDYYLFWEKQKLPKQHQKLYKEMIKNISTKDWVLSHNDLNRRNIILNEEKNKIHFIDFEWTRINHKLWDISNFIREENLKVTTIKFIANFLRVPYLELLEFIYLCTNFAVQWTYGTKETDEILKYREKTLKMLEIFKNRMIVERKKQEK